MLLLRNSEHNWRLYISPKNSTECGTQNEVYNKILECSENTGLSEAIQRQVIRVKTVTQSPVDFTVPRTEILTKVRNGKLPKGILKKWPLYLLILESKDKNL